MTHILPSSMSHNYYDSYSLIFFESSKVTESLWLNILTLCDLFQTSIYTRTSFLFLFFRQINKQQEAQEVLSLKRLWAPQLPGETTNWQVQDTTSALKNYKLFSPLLAFIDNIPLTSCHPLQASLVSLLSSNSWTRTTTIPGKEPPRLSLPTLAVGTLSLV